MKLLGTVVSNKMDQTVVVKVERLSVHPIYQKRLTRSKKYLAQSKEAIPVGSLIEIESTRPLSHRKRWKVIRVIKKSEVSE